MKKISNLFLLLIILFGCKEELNLGYSHTFYLVNMTNDTFLVFTYRRTGDVGFHIPMDNGKRIMLPKDRLVFAYNDFSYYIKDSILIYKYNDTNNVYISFKFNKNPYNYKLNCYNKSHWSSDTIYYTRHQRSYGLEVYYVRKESLFKIEKSKIINP